MAMRQPGRKWGNKSQRWQIKIRICYLYVAVMLFFHQLQDRKGHRHFSTPSNFISLHTAILMPAHEKVIAFYYVRAADIFDTVTIARHLAGWLLASLFTTLTSYIILPTQYCHVPRQFLCAQTKSGRRPDVFPCRQQKISLSFERLLRHNEVVAGQKLTRVTAQTNSKTHYIQMDFLTFVLFNSSVTDQNVR